MKALRFLSHLFFVLLWLVSMACAVILPALMIVWVIVAGIWVSANVPRSLSK